MCAVCAVYVVYKQSFAPRKHRVHLLRFCATLFHQRRQLEDRQDNRHGNEADDAAHEHNHDRFNHAGNGFDRFGDLHKIVNEELSNEPDLQKFTGNHGRKEVQGHLKRAAWRRIFDSPVEFLSMASTEKMCILWTPSIMFYKQERILNSFLISFTVLSALSLLFVYGVEDRRAMMLLLLASILVTACSACHFMLESWPRYRFHCVPWLIIFSTLSMHTLSCKFVNRTRQGANQ